ncbi:PAS domain-containing hybrid sensor histidine kinase/response regulator [Cypionkella sinensis]|uniref:histidine kinase n=1 Tax=Cypionkella sinensis TaxID=1756043 RepID=A0ABV7J2B6_9RHOB
MAAALDQLCDVVGLDGIAIYRRAEAGRVHLCHHAARLDGVRPAVVGRAVSRLVQACWMGDAVAPGAVQVSDIAAGDFAGGQEPGAVVLPMLEGGRCVGAVGYWLAQTAAPVDMRPLTDLLHGLLAQAASVPQEAQMQALAAAAEAAHIRLNNAIQALPDAVVIFDAEHRLLAVNAAYQQMFPEIAEYAMPGMPLAELLRAGLRKQTFFAAASEAQQEAWLQARLTQYREPYSEDEVRLPDGRWMRRVSTRTADGGLIAMGFDITARRNHLAALDAANCDLKNVLADRDRAEQHLSGIIEGAAVGIWDLDVISRKIGVGGRWGEIIGLETAKLSNLAEDDFLALLHPDDRAAILSDRSYTHVLPGALASVEFRMRHAQGHWVWILSRYRISERAADGSASRVSGVHLDISAQKQLEQEAFAARAFLQDVMDASGCAIVVLDTAYRISYVNQEADDLLRQICEADAGGAPDITKLRLQHRDGTALAPDQSPFALALRAVRPMQDVPYAFLRDDGTRGVLAFNMALLDMGDEHFGVVRFTDVTEALAATERLQEALIRAEEMSRAKSTFLANMSHEIRTPLNGVLGMAEVLADTVVEPIQRQMIDTIRKSGETLLTVLNGILDMSKIEAGKMALELAPFVPLELIRQAESIFTIAAEEKGLAFEVLATAGCDKPRLGDAHRLMQVLNNLLNNAFKFTERGSVTLKFSCRSGKPVQIEVSDTGIGMGETQLARVFESFEQADGSMTRRFGGTGLGLSIVRELVTLMGGEITVDSTPEVGSVFRITLPLAEVDAAPAPQAKPKSDHLQEDGLAGVRLLCADDNATNRLVLSEMLGRTGAVVTQVENGQEVIAAWQAALDRGTPYDLLLLDITMPVLDGMSALEQIRSIESARELPAVLAVAITAHAMPSQIADYLIGGFDSHLAKPFRRLDLLHVLHSLLRL